MSASVKSGNWVRPLLHAGLFLAAIVAVSMAILFLFSSAFSGFVVQTPGGLIKCRDPLNLLGWMLLAWLAWLILRNLSLRLWPVSSPVPEYSAPSPGELKCITGSLVLLTFLYWLRSLYRTYERYLLKLSDHLSIPWWQSHLLYVAVLIGVLFVWYQIRHSGGVAAGIVAALLLTVSPTSFYVSRNMVVGFVLLILIWISVSAAMPAGKSGKRYVLIWLILVMAAIALAAGFHAWGPGWGLRRCYTQLLSRSLPGLLWIPALAGLVSVFTRAGNNPAMVRAALLMIPLGLALAGTRAELGDLGTLLLLPAGVVLPALGIHFLRVKSIMGRTVLGRNLIVIVMVGILFGVLKSGIDRSIRPPDYVSIPSAGERK